MFDFATFHAEVGFAAPGQPPMDAASLMELMGRSARLFHPGARLSVITDTESAAYAAGFERHPYPVRPERLMLDRTLSQARYVGRHDFAVPVVLLDTDILFTASLAPLLDEDFDVLLTWRDQADVPINGGFMVLGARRPEMGRRFFDRFAGAFESGFAEHAAWNGDQLALASLLPPEVNFQAGVARFELDGIRVMAAPCDVLNHAPPNRAFGIVRPLTEPSVLHFKGPRKWLMPLYWAAHLAPLEDPGADPAEALAEIWRAALADLRGAAAKLRTAMSTVHVREATAALKVYDSAAAARAIDAALALRPDNGEAWLRRAILLGRDAPLEVALAAFGQAGRLLPGDRRIGEKVAALIAESAEAQLSAAS